MRGDRWRRGSIARGALKGLLIVVLSLAGLVVAGYALSKWSPSWWGDPVARRSDASANERARDLEQHLASAVHRIRDEGEPWAIRIRADDLNDWLAARLAEWTAHDPAFAWPIEGAIGQVHFQSGEAVLGLSIDGRVWSGAFALVVEPDRIRIQPGSAAVGRMPLPVGAELIMKLLEGNAASALTLPRVYPLGDGRRIEVRRIDLVDGAIELELTTLR